MMTIELKKNQDVSSIIGRMQCNKDIFILKCDMQEWWEKMSCYSK